MSGNLIPISMKRKPKLKLYVWENVLTDYTDGMMCALATSPEQARKLLLKRCSYIPENQLAEEPKVVSKPEAFLVWGGG